MDIESKRVMFSLKTLNVGQVAYSDETSSVFLSNNRVDQIDLRTGKVCATLETPLHQYIGVHDKRIHLVQFVDGQRSVTRIDMRNNRNVDTSRGGDFCVLKQGVLPISCSNDNLLFIPCKGSCYDMATGE